MRGILGVPSERDDPGPADGCLITEMLWIFGAPSKPDTASFLLVAAAAAAAHREHPFLMLGVMRSWLCCSHHSVVVPSATTKGEERSKLSTASSL